MGQYYMIQDYVSHHGIKGMKWGIRRYQNKDGSYTPEGKRRYSHSEKVTMRQARKDADEYARAKMFYGEGAGTRRKLIKAKVKSKSVDPLYKQTFNEALSKKDMGKEADAARGERQRIDARNKGKKTLNGASRLITGQGLAAVGVAIAATYYVKHRQQVNNFVQRRAWDVNYAASKVSGVAKSWMRRRGL